MQLPKIVCSKHILCALCKCTLAYPTAVLQYKNEGDTYIRNKVLGKCSPSVALIWLNTGKNDRIRMTPFMLHRARYAKRNTPRDSDGIGSLRPWSMSPGSTVE